MVFRIEITDVRDAGWGTGRRDQDPLTDPESRKWCFKLPFLLRLKFECATCQQIYTGLWRHSLLMTMADAPPPPLQMLARPRLPSGRLCVMWAINREPDIPIGCPIDTAPPCILTLPGSNSMSCKHRRETFNFNFRVWVREPASWETWNKNRERKTQGNQRIEKF